jgi:predicted aspartyl protease
MHDRKPQSVIKKADTRLPLKRDIAGLWNIPVNINDSTYGFVFDSGAGISVISHSFAKKLGIEIIPGFEVPVAGGLNGIMTRSKLGIAPLIHIGEIEFRDVLFLVFPDSSLSFAKGYYTINGIIGYPVINGFSSFSISGDEISIPKSPESKSVKRNLVIDGLKPVIYLH